MNIIETRDAIFRIKNGDIKVEISNNATNVLKVRLNLVAEFFTAAINDLGINNFEFVLNLCDLADLENKYSLPYICLAKYKHCNYELIPTTDFFSGLIYSVLNQSNNDIPYDSKKNKSIFVGSSTNGKKRVEYCYSLIGNSTHIGIINSLCQRSHEEWIKDFPDINKCLGSSMSIPEQLKNKIVVNIDGNAMCWSRLYWQMNSNSVPVYISKNNDYEQYFDRFNDDLCYFNTDFNNYLQTYEFIFDENNIHEVNTIINNGRIYCQNTFGEYMINPKAYLLKTIRSAIEKVYND